MSVSVRQLFFPYCLLLQEDGRYAIVNRRYKPVGMTVEQKVFVKYEEHPCLVKLTGLTPPHAATISCSGSDALDRVYLYNDGCVPTDSAHHWAAYCTRLQVLAKLTAHD